LVEILHDNQHQLLLLFIKLCPVSCQEIIAKAIAVALNLISKVTRNEYLEQHADSTKHKRVELKFVLEPEILNVKSNFKSQFTFPIMLNITQHSTTINPSPDMKKAVVKEALNPATILWKNET